MLHAEKLLCATVKSWEGGARDKVGDTVHFELTSMYLALHVDLLSVWIRGGSQKDSWHLPPLVGGANGRDVRHYVGIGFGLRSVPVLNGIIIMLQWV